jgi:aminopeptidase N
MLRCLHTDGGGIRFGNLVTMEWWTHLWLNEGFARFLEFFAVNDAFPDWGIWTTFVAAIYDVALRSDALSSSHAIEVTRALGICLTGWLTGGSGAGAAQVPVTRPEEINEIFDTISYAKGASVIRMLSEYLGPATLFAGLRLYLQRHQYGNATTEDLWRAFEEASGKQVRPPPHARSVRDSPLC